MIGLMVNPVTDLQGSGEFVGVAHCKQLGRYIYLSDQQRLFLYHEDGRLLKKIVSRGQGPNEIDRIEYIFRDSGYLWVTSRYWALRIKDDQVLEKIKTQGSLSDVFEGTRYFQWMQRQRKSTFMAYALDPLTEKRVPFFEASRAITANNFRIQIATVLMHGPFLAYGDGLSNEFYIQNVGADHVSRVRVLLSILRPYSPEAHGTLSQFSGKDRHRVNNFFTKFDLPPGRGKSFWLEYRGAPYLLLSWYNRNSKQFLYQIFDHEGHYKGFRLTPYAPVDWDEQGNIWIVMRADDSGDSDFQVLRLSMDEFFANAPR